MIFWMARVRAWLVFAVVPFGLAVIAACVGDDPGTVAPTAAPDGSTGDAIGSGDAGARDGEAPCEAGVRCNGRCVDLSVDRDNCGECGKTCAPNLVCDRRECSATCGTPQTTFCQLDGGFPYCANLNTDPKNCNACGRVCATGVCQSNECQRLAFVTSATFGAAMSVGENWGWEGPDKRCAALAADAGLPGTYRAWVAANASSPGTRLTPSGVAFLRRDGVAIATSTTDLRDGQLTNPITIDEHGQLVPDASAVWTGANVEGSQISACNEWENGVSGQGTIGRTGFTNAAWTNASLQDCTQQARLYCFEQ
jgi:hypothetical protein